MRDAEVVRRRRMGPRPGAQHYPAFTIIFATLLALWPISVASEWWPDLAYLTLIAWRLRRSDAFPHWWAVPFGLLNDLILGHPLGMSVVIFTLAMIGANLVDLRLRWRSHWTEWAVAAVLIAMAEYIQWLVAVIEGATGPLADVIPGIVIASLTFPVIAALIGWLDDYRLRR